MVKKRFLTVLLIALTFLLLVGCSVDPREMPPPSPDNGFWDRFFVFPLNVTLEWFADLLFSSYGLSIIAVTIVIRLLLLPLTIKQLKSSKAMQALQPQMTKIREKYKDNQQKLQEETMKLFQEHNVNPMSGCMPILIQMPILIAFYQAIIRNDHIREATFVGLQLGSEPAWYTLPILAALTTYLQSYMMGTNNNPQVKMMMTIMPVMIFFFALYLPAALSLYWVFGNIFTVVQTYFLRDMYKANKEGTAK